MSDNLDFEYSEEHPDITILDPKIIVFHNVVSDCKAHIDYYEKEAVWEPWYKFGEKIKVSGGGLRTQGAEFPSLDMWNQNIVNIEVPGSGRDPYREELATSFYRASKFYVDYTEHTQPNWVIMPWSLSRYIPDVDIIGSEDLTMNYHTDYMLDDMDTPADKFSITAVFYANDEYEGGEISFRILNDANSWEQIDYKPKAGDLVMFPSKHPYYHGVKRINKAPKYITRMYWLYSYEGSEDWHELNAKYGAEKFAELEKQRRKRPDLMKMNPYMRPRFTLKEYYELLDSGNLLPSYSRQLKDPDLDQ